METKINCPFCGKDLDKPTTVDFNTVGWSCIHKGFEIKIYKVNF